MSVVATAYRIEAALLGSAGERLSPRHLHHRVGTLNAHIRQRVFSGCPVRPASAASCADKEEAKKAGGISVRHHFTSVTVRTSTERFSEKGNV